MAFALGIDVGSAFCKGVILENGEFRGSAQGPSGGDFKTAAEKVREKLLAAVGISAADVGRTVATGYGARSAIFATDIKPDVVCDAKAIFVHLPTVRTVVDVGDLYTKVFRLDSSGNVGSFLHSGKCAGGSGRILQVVAKVLGVKLEEMGDFSLRSKNRVEIHTGCAVFSESEVLTRISEGVMKEDILAGIHRSLAAQINGLIERIGVQPDVAMVGGGAINAGLVRALEEIRGHKILVPRSPHLIAAHGAAMLASEKIG